MGRYPVAITRRDTHHRGRRLAARDRLRGDSSDHHRPAGTTYDHRRQRRDTGGNAATSSTVKDEATAQSVIDLAESTEAALAKDAAGTIAAINAGDERFTDPVRPDITGRL